MGLDRPHRQRLAYCLLGSPSGCLEPLATRMSTGHSRSRSRPRGSESHKPFMRNIKPATSVTGYCISGGGHGTRPSASPKARVLPSRQPERLPRTARYSNVHRTFSLALAPSRVRVPQAFHEKYKTRH